MYYLSTLLIISLTNVYTTQAGFLDDFKQILIHLPHWRRVNTISVDPVNVGEPLTKILQAAKPVKVEKKHAGPVHAKEEDSSSLVEIPVMRNHHKHHHESLVYNIDDPHIMNVDMDWR